MIVKSHCHLVKIFLNEINEVTFVILICAIQDYEPQKTL